MPRLNHRPEVRSVIIACFTLLGASPLGMLGCGSSEDRVQDEPNVGGAGGTSATASGALGGGGASSAATGAGGTQATASGGNTNAGTSLGGTSSGFMTWTYKEQPVGFYMPEAATGPVPVVLYLHACHNDPISESFWLISAINAIEPCAVLLPLRPESESSQCAAWGGTYDAEPRQSILDALDQLDTVVGQYALDQKRQYVYGESMGAEGVFRILVDRPAQFAGAVAVAGYTVDKGASEMAKTPLWIVHGGADTINKVDSVETIYASILAAGGTNVKFTKYDDLDHVPAIEQARTEPEILEWLLGQVRP